MNEFDEQKAVLRLVELYRERGLERTHADVRKIVAGMARAEGIEPAAAYEELENRLLTTNPNPEKWD